MSRAHGLPRLLWISPGEGVGEKLLRTLRAAVRGGLRAFQLREKASFARTLHEIAPELRRILPREDGSLLLINDRVDVAMSADFDGVQLGHGSLPVRSARQVLGTPKRIGCSVHDLDELRGAEAGGADFVIASPIYPVRKRGLPPAPPLGLVGLRRICEASSLPVYALGGVTPTSVPELLQQGVHGVAVMSTIAKASDPAAIVESFVAALSSAD